MARTNEMLPRKGKRERAAVRRGVVVSLVLGSGHGSDHSSESCSSQAGHQSSVSDEGQELLVAAKRRRRKMARAESQ